ncbi:MAG: SPASM domain-containing protein [Eubacteriales bacterium]
MATSSGDLKKLFLELTLRCNLNCMTCFRHNWEIPIVDMPGETARKIAGDLESFPEVDEIVFGGIGEPTLHPDFSNIVTLFAKYSLGLTSNAYYWSEESLDTIVRYFDRIIVSVDGLAETFKEIRGFDLRILQNNLLRLAEKKKEMHRLRPLVHAQLVLSKVNVEEVQALIPILHQMGVMKLIISNLLPQNNQSKDQILYTLDSNGFMREKRNLWLQTCLGNQMQLKMPNIELKTERRCNFIEDATTYICADGQVAPCYRFAHPDVEYVFGRRKQVLPLYFGNVVYTALKDIWNNPKYVDLRLQNYTNRFPSCPDCDLIDCCDYISDSQCDCKGQSPSCGDCLWSRGFVECG